MFGFKFHVKVLPRFTFCLGFPPNGTPAESDRVTMAAGLYVCTCRHAEVEEAVRPPSPSSSSVLHRGNLGRGDQCRREVDRIGSDQRSEFVLALYLLAPISMFHSRTINFIWSNLERLLQLEVPDDGTNRLPFLAWKQSTLVSVIWRVTEYMQKHLDMD